MLMVIHQKQSNILPDVVVASEIIFPLIDIDSLNVGILSVAVNIFSDVGEATLYDMYHYDAINFLSKIRLD